MHYYKILKHNAGFDEGTNYWEKILARYVAATGGGKIHTTLPITFTSTSWKLASWTIYGNNTPNNYSAEGTLPLTFTTHTAGNADDWSISGNDKVGKNLLNIESATKSLYVIINSVDNSTGSISATVESGYTYRGANVILTNLLEVGKTYVITLTKNNATPSEQLANATLRRVDNNMIVASAGSAAFVAAGDKTFSYTHTQERAEQGIYFSLLVTGNATTGGTVSVSNLMIREATTSADFEPYQVGVGQKKTTVIANTDLEQGYTSTNTSKTYEQNKVFATNRLRTPSLITVINNISNILSINDGYEFALRWYSNGLYAASTGWNTYYTIPANFAYNSFGLTIRKPDNSDITNAESITITIQEQTYSIPLNINNTTQDIYIGSTPLTDGETISKTSTGVDIAAIAGSNTITTDLYNKPEMSIEGVDYVGVGQHTINLFNATIEQGGLNSGAEYNSSTRVRTTFMSNMLDAGTYTINASGVNAVVVNYFDDNKIYTEGVTTWRTLPFTFNISSRRYVRFAFKKSNSQGVTPSDISNTMLVEGSTAPQTFIPYGYEIPLDIRHKTKNKFEITNTSSTTTDVIVTVDPDAGTVTSAGTPTAERCFYPQGTQKRDISDAFFSNGDILTCEGIISGIMFSLSYYTSDGTFLSRQAVNNTTSTVTVDIPQNAGRYRLLFTFTAGNPSNTTMYPMLRPADTSPEFEPYYLTNHEDIYIGDSPLTEGQTVSNTTEIEVFEGENTIDTTLYNKPEMEIVYE